LKGISIARGQWIGPSLGVALGAGSAWGWKVGAQTHLWWLSFLGGNAVIMEASSLVHARLLAASNNLGRISQFDEGYAVNTDLVACIPDNSIGRMLSAVEARQILKLLKYGQRNYLSASPDA
jgi:hypothetical protein